MFHLESIRKRVPKKAVVATWKPDGFLVKGKNHLSLVGAFGFLSGKLVYG